MVVDKVMALPFVGKRVWLAPMGAAGPRARGRYKEGTTRCDPAVAAGKLPSTAHKRCKKSA